jgi:ribosomal protein S18 acetylase RimI-like enzyme
MDFYIRTAKKEDIPVIAELNSQLADYHREMDTYYKPGSETREEFKDYLSKIIEEESIRILVAESNSTLIGYSIGTIEVAKRFITPEKIGKISDAFIKPAHRNKGIGKEMIDDLLCWFKQNEIQYVELSVDSKNKNSIAAWEKFGFRECMKKMRLDLE